MLRTSSTLVVLKRSAAHVRHQQRLLLRRRLLTQSSATKKNGRLLAPNAKAALLQPRLENVSPASLIALDFDKWFIPKPGTGFDNFIPKNDKNKKRGDDGNDKESTSDNSDKKDDGSFFSGGNGNNNNNNNSQLWGAFVLLAVTYILLQLDPDSNSSKDPSQQNQPLNSREITWNEFVHPLLEQNQVERIVVTNQKTMAKVFLKPGAPGVPRYGSSGRPRPLRIGPPSAAGAPDDHHHPPDEFTTNTTGMSNAAGGGGKGHQLVYRFAIGSVDTFERKLEDAQLALGMSRHDFVPVQYTADSTIATEFMSIVPTLLLMGVVFGLLRGAMGGMPGSSAGGRGGGGIGGIFQVGKSTAKKIQQEDVGVTFADVAGCQEAKKEIMEFVDFLSEPEQFTKLGAKIPKGALLCGPPGTGKTLLAKAVAGEAGVPFYSISGSDFIEMFVGVGPSRVRDLFKEARANSPCIVFIDEIDAVGRQRGRAGIGGNDERENTLNQLLVEMDGFTSSTGVVVLAGTNRIDILDQALTRPGRFDRQITVDKPDLQGRKEIFQVHLKGLTLEDEIDEIAGRLAGLTPGFAGADIANICNEAAIVAARREADAVALRDFESATDRVIGGLESNKIMSKDEQSIVAHHEAGHAVAGWFLEHADPLLKVTIIPRSSGALGFAQYLPKEVFLRTQEQIMDIVCMTLAGRAAEEIFFGRVTTGASDDLKRVTELVYSTIQVYGMNSRLGQLAFPKDPNAMWEDRPYSDATAMAMDEEAKDIVDAAYQRTLELLREKKTEVEQVAKLLLEKETITHDDIVDLIGARPFKGDPQYEEFIKKGKINKDEQESSSSEVTTKKEDNTEAEDVGPLNPGLA